MKKTIKLLAALMIVATLAVSLVSCTTILMGTYSAEVDWFVGETTITYEFAMFGKVTKTTTTESLFGNPEAVTVTGKYEISEDPSNPDKLLISFEFEGEERVTYPFSTGNIDGKSIIIINGSTFEKKD